MRQLAQHTASGVVAESPSVTAAWPRGPVDAGLKSFLRGYYDGRYRFARYFEPGDYHLPRDWQTLIARNELELYDTLNDVAEMTNLAEAPEEHKQLLLELNARLNALIESEEGGPDVVPS
jgi:arylsulfatase